MLFAKYLTTSMFLLSAILTCAVGTALVGKTLSAYRIVQAAEQEGARFPRGDPQAPPRTFRSMALLRTRQRGEKRARQSFG